MRTVNIIRSDRHELHSVEMNKIVLYADDDERVVMNDGILTLAPGHCRSKG